MNNPFERIEFQKSISHDFQNMEKLIQEIKKLKKTKTVERIDTNILNNLKEGIFQKNNPLITFFESMLSKSETTIEESTKEKITHCRNLYRTIQNASSPEWLLYLTKDHSRVKKIGRYFFEKKLNELNKKIKELDEKSDEAIESEEKITRNKKLKDKKKSNKQAESWYLKHIYKKIELNITACFPYARKTSGENKKIKREKVKKKCFKNHADELTLWDTYKTRKSNFQKLFSELKNFEWITNCNNLKYKELGLNELTRCIMFLYNKKKKEFLKILMELAEEENKIQKNRKSNVNQDEINTLFSGEQDNTYIYNVLKEAFFSEKSDEGLFRLISKNKSVFFLLTSKKIESRKNNSFLDNFFKLTQLSSPGPQLKKFIAKHRKLIATSITQENGDIKSINIEAEIKTIKKNKNINEKKSALLALFPTDQSKNQFTAALYFSLKEKMTRNLIVQIIKNSESRTNPKIKTEETEKEKNFKTILRHYILGETLEQSPAIIESTPKIHQGNQTKKATSLFPEKNEWLTQILLDHPNILYTFFNPNKTSLEHQLTNFRKILHLTSDPIKLSKMILKSVKNKKTRNKLLLILVTHCAEQGLDLRKLQSMKINRKRLFGFIPTGKKSLASCVNSAMSEYIKTTRQSSSSNQANNNPILERCLEICITNDELRTMVYGKNGKEGIVNHDFALYNYITRKNTPNWVHKKISGITDLSALISRLHNTRTTCAASLKSTSENFKNSGSESNKNKINPYKYFTLLQISPYYCRINNQSNQNESPVISLVEKLTGENFHTFIKDCGTGETAEEQKKNGKEKIKNLIKEDQELKNLLLEKFNLGNKKIIKRLNAISPDIFDFKDKKQMRSYIKEINNKKSGSKDKIKSPKIENKIERELLIIPLEETKPYSKEIEKPMGGNKNFLKNLHARLELMLDLIEKKEGEDILEEIDLINFIYYKLKSEEKKNEILKKINYDIAKKITLALASNGLKSNSSIFQELIKKFPILLEECSILEKAVDALDIAENSGSFIVILNRVNASNSTDKKNQKKILVNKIFNFNKKEMFSLAMRHSEIWQEIKNDFRLFVDVDFSLILDEISNLFNSTDPLDHQQELIIRLLEKIVENNSPAHYKKELKHLIERVYNKEEIYDWVLKFSSQSKYNPLCKLLLDLFKEYCFFDEVLKNEGVRKKKFFDAFKKITSPENQDNRDLLCYIIRNDILNVKDSVEDNYLYGLEENIIEFINHLMLTNSKTFHGFLEDSGNKIVYEKIKTCAAAENTFLEFLGNQKIIKALLEKGFEDYENLLGYRYFNRIPDVHKYVFFMFVNSLEKCEREIKEDIKLIINTFNDEEKKCDLKILIKILNTFKSNEKIVAQFNSSLDENSIKRLLINCKKNSVYSVIASYRKVSNYMETLKENAFLGYIFDVKNFYDENISLDSIKKYLTQEKGGIDFIFTTINSIPEPTFTLIGKKLISLLLNSFFTTKEALFELASYNKSACPRLINQLYANDRNRTKLLYACDNSISQLFAYLYESKNEGLENKVLTFLIEDKENRHIKSLLNEGSYPPEMLKQIIKYIKTNREFTHSLDADFIINILKNTKKDDVVSLEDIQTFLALLDDNKISNLITALLKKITEESLKLKQRKNSSLYVLFAEILRRNGEHKDNFVKSISENLIFLSNIFSLEDKTINKEINSIFEKTPNKLFRLIVVLANQENTSELTSLELKPASDIIKNLEQIILFFIQKVKQESLGFYLENSGDWRLIIKFFSTSNNENIISEFKKAISDTPVFLLNLITINAWSPSKNKSDITALVNLLKSTEFDGLQQSDKDKFIDKIFTDETIEWIWEFSESSEIKILICKFIKFLDKISQQETEILSEKLIGVQELEKSNIKTAISSYKKLYNYIQNHSEIESENEVLQALINKISTHLLKNPIEKDYALMSDILNDDSSPLYLYFTKNNLLTLYLEKFQSKISDILVVVATSTDTQKQIYFDYYKRNIERLKDAIDKHVLTKETFLLILSWLDNRSFYEKCESNELFYSFFFKIEDEATRNKFIEKIKGCSLEKIMRDIVSSTHISDKKILENNPDLLVKILNSPLRERETFIKNKKIIGIIKENIKLREILFDSLGIKENESLLLYLLETVFAEDQSNENEIILILEKKITLDESGYFTKNLEYVWINLLLNKNNQEIKIKLLNNRTCRNKISQKRNLSVEERTIILKSDSYKEYTNVESIIEVIDEGSNSSSELYNNLIVLLGKEKSVSESNKELLPYYELYFLYSKEKLSQEIKTKLSGTNFLNKIKFLYESRKELSTSKPHFPILKIIEKYSPKSEIENEKNSLLCSESEKNSLEKIYVDLLEKNRGWIRTTYRLKIDSPDFGTHLILYFKTYYSIKKLSKPFSGIEEKMINLIEKLTEEILINNLTLGEKIKLLSYMSSIYFSIHRDKYQIKLLIKGKIIILIKNIYGNINRHFEFLNKFSEPGLYFNKLGGILKNVEEVLFIMKKLNEALKEKEIAHYYSEFFILASRLMHSLYEESLSLSYIKNIISIKEGMIKNPGYFEKNHDISDYLINNQEFIFNDPSDNTLIETETDIREKIIDFSISHLTKNYIHNTLKTLKENLLSSASFDEKKLLNLIQLLFDFKFHYPNGISFSQEITLKEPEITERIYFNIERLKSYEGLAVLCIKLISMDNTKSKPWLNEFRNKIISKFVSVSQGYDISLNKKVSILNNVLVNIKNELFHKENEFYKKYYCAVMLRYFSCRNTLVTYSKKYTEKKPSLEELFDIQDLRLAFEQQPVLLFIQLINNGYSNDLITLLFSNGLGEAYKNLSSLIEMVDLSITKGEIPEILTDPYLNNLKILSFIVSKNKSEKTKKSNLLKKFYSENYHEFEKILLKIPVPFTEAIKTEDENIICFYLRHLDNTKTPLTEEDITFIKNNLNQESSLSEKIKSCLLYYPNLYFLLAPEERALLKQESEKKVTKEIIKKLVRDEKEKNNESKTQKTILLTDPNTSWEKPKQSTGEISKEQNKPKDEAFSKDVSGLAADTDSTIAPPPPPPPPPSLTSNTGLTSTLSAATTPPPPPPPSTGKNSCFLRIGKKQTNKISAIKNKTSVTGNKKNNLDKVNKIIFEFTQKNNIELDSIQKERINKFITCFKKSSAFKSDEFLNIVNSLNDSLDDSKEKIDLYSKLFFFLKENNKEIFFAIRIKLDKLITNNYGALKFINKALLKKEFVDPTFLTYFNKLYSYAEIENDNEIIGLIEKDKELFVSILNIEGFDYTTTEEKTTNKEKKFPFRKAAISTKEYINFNIIDLFLTKNKSIIKWDSLNKEESSCMITIFFILLDLKDSSKEKYETHLDFIEKCQTHFLTFNPDVLLLFTKKIRKAFLTKHFDSLKNILTGIIDRDICNAIDCELLNLIYQYDSTLREKIKGSNKWINKFLSEKKFTINLNAHFTNRSSVNSRSIETDFITHLLNVDSLSLNTNSILSLYQMILKFEIELLKKYTCIHTENIDTIDLQTQPLNRLIFSIKDDEINLMAKNKDGSKFSKIIYLKNLSSLEQKSINVLKDNKDCISPKGTLFEKIILETLWGISCSILTKKLNLNGITNPSKKILIEILPDITLSEYLSLSDSYNNLFDLFKDSFIQPPAFNENQLLFIKNLFLFIVKNKNEFNDIQWKLDNKNQYVEKECLSSHLKLFLKLEDFIFQKSTLETYLSHVSLENLSDICCNEYPIINRDGKNVYLMIYYLIKKLDENRSFESKNNTGFDLFNTLEKILEIAYLEKRNESEISLKNVNFKLFFNNHYNDLRDIILGNYSLFKHLLLKNSVCFNNAVTIEKSTSSHKDEQKIKEWLALSTRKAGDYYLCATNENSKIKLYRIPPLPLSEKEIGNFSSIPLEENTLSLKLTTLLDDSFIKKFKETESITCSFNELKGDLSYLNSNPIIQALFYKEDPSSYNKNERFLKFLNVHWENILHDKERNIVIEKLIYLDNPEINNFIFDNLKFLPLVCSIIDPKSKRPLFDKKPDFIERLNTFFNKCQSPKKILPSKVSALKKNETGKEKKSGPLSLMEELNLKNKKRFSEETEAPEKTNTEKSNEFLSLLLEKTDYHSNSLYNLICYGDPLLREKLLSYKELKYKISILFESLPFEKFETFLLEIKEDTKNRDAFYILLSDHLPKDRILTLLALDNKDLGKSENDIYSTIKRVSEKINSFTSSHNVKQLSNLFKIFSKIKSITEIPLTSIEAVLYMELDFIQNILRDAYNHSPYQEKVVAIYTSLRKKVNLDKNDAPFCDENKKLFDFFASNWAFYEPYIKSLIKEKKLEIADTFLLLNCCTREEIKTFVKENKDNMSINIQTILNHKHMHYRYIDLNFEFFLPTLDKIKSNLSLGQLNKLILPTKTAEIRNWIKTIYQSNKLLVLEYLNAKDTDCHNNWELILPAIENNSNSIFNSNIYIPLTKLCDNNGLFNENISPALSNRFIAHPALLVSLLSSNLEIPSFSRNEIFDQINIFLLKNEKFFKSVVQQLIERKLIDNDSLIRILQSPCETIILDILSDEKFSFNLKDKIKPIIASWAHEFKHKDKDNIYSKIFISAIKQENTLSLFDGVLTDDDIIHLVKNYYMDNVIMGKIKILSESMYSKNLNVFQENSQEYSSLITYEEFKLRFSRNDLHSKKSSSPLMQKNLFNEKNKRNIPIPLSSTAATPSSPLPFNNV